MKAKKLLFSIYLILFSFIFFMVPVYGADSYYFEQGPIIPNKVLTREPLAEEKRISNITDPVLKLQELNKQNYEEVSEWTRFNSGEFGIVTPADNQGFYNTCWSHSIANVSEIAILRDGLLPQTATKDFKLSANSIAYTTANRRSEDDKLLNTSTDVEYGEWNEGHMISEAVGKLTQWVAPALSTRVTDEHIGEFLEPAYYVKDIIKINPNKPEEIKRAIAQYGAVTMSYDTDIKHDDFYNSNEIKTYYDNLNKTIDIGRHAITIFGWDDSVGEDNFKYNKPNKPGAWLTKNSWGASHGTNGTQYLSYDSPIKEVYALTYQEADKDLNNYYYDGTTYYGHDYISDSKEVTVGAIFESKVASSTKDEYLESINVGIDGTNVEVKVEVYKDVKANLGNKFERNNNPTNGVLVSSATTTKSFWTSGNWEIKLNNPVKLEPNEIYSVVVTASSKLGNVGIEVVSEPNSLNDHTYFQTENGIFKNTSIDNDQVVRLKAHTRTLKKGELKQSFDLKDARVLLENSVYSYNGNPYESRFLKPIVKIDDKTLIEGKDYLVSYEETTLIPDNIKVKSLISGYVEIKITGINDYKGTFNHIYTQNKMITYPTASSFVDNGFYIEYKVNKDKQTLKDVILPDGWKFKESLNQTIDESKFYKVYYSGKDKFRFTDNEREIKLIKTKSTDMDINSDSLNVQVSGNDFIYNGSEIRPDVTISYNGNNLVFKKDYIVEYVNNINVGVASIIIRGIGDFTGKKVINFNISKNLDNYISNFSIINSHAYAKARFGDVLFNYYEDEKLTKLVSELEIGKTYFVKPYTLDTDNYKGVSESETIKPLKFVCLNKVDRPETIDYFERANIKLSATSFKYNGFNQKPDITIIVGDKKLKKDIDYKVEFMANDLMNAGVKKVKITGINDYEMSGSFIFEYEITKLDNELLKFDLVEGEIVVETKYGNEYILKYFIDKGCINQITLEEAKKLDVYYVTVYIPALKNYNAVKVNKVLEIENYHEPSNLNELKTLISELDELEQDKYTKESYDDFLNILNTVKSKLDQKLKEDEVNELINELNSAKESLVIYKEPINKTPIIVGISCAFIAIMFVVIGVIFNIKKRKAR